MCADGALVEVFLWLQYCMQHFRMLVSSCCCPECAESLAACGHSSVFENPPYFLEDSAYNLFLGFHVSTCVDSVE